MYPLMFPRHRLKDGIEVLDEFLASLRVHRQIAIQLNRLLARGRLSGARCGCGEHDARAASTVHGFSC